MNPMDLNKPQPKSEQMAYIYKGRLFVPHYDTRELFVAPGHNKNTPRVFHELQLKGIGAIAVKLQLWPRSYM